MNKWKVLQTEKRRVRMLTFVANAAGTALTGVDADKVTMADTGTGVKTITLAKPFKDAEYSVQVTLGTSASVAHVEKTSSSVFVIKTFAMDGTTAKDAITDVLVIGQDKTSLS